MQRLRTATTLYTIRSSGSVPFSGSRLVLAAFPRLSRCGVVVDFGSSVEVTVALPERDAQVDETPTCVIFDQGTDSFGSGSRGISWAGRFVITHVLKEHVQPAWCRQVMSGMSC